jgi:CRP/FNR family cyclic AMP-dependent transcriptional regulator
MKRVAPVGRSGYGRLEHPAHEGVAMNQARLKEVPFFSNLKKKELELIARQADEIDVTAGKVLAKQGDLGDEFFVIEEGTADVARDGERINTLGPGDFFGEMALLEEDRRNATVTAATPMALIVMTRASFRAIDKSMPHVHKTVQEAIQQRRVPTG